LSVSSETARRTSLGGYGLPTLVLLVVANMIGSGLYTTSGFSLGALGSARWVLIVWGVGGAIALMGAVAYGALARRLPLSGGEYLFLSRLVHPMVGFTAGWISLVAGFTGPLAAASLVVGTYAIGVGEGADGTVRTVATVVLMVCGAIQLTTLGIGAWTHNLAVMAKLALLVSLLVTPLWLEPAGGWQSGYLSDVVGEIQPGPVPLVLAMLGALVWVLLSYSGFNAAVYLAGQAEHPRRNVPLAMLLGTLLVTALYIPLNAVFLYAPAPAAIANQATVASIAAQALGGDWLEGFVRSVIVISAITSIFSLLLAGPRVYAQMAEDGRLPQLFRLTPSGIPRQAIVVQTVLAVTVVWLSTLEQLIGYLGLTLSACGALAVGSLFVINRRIAEPVPLRWWEAVAAATYVLAIVIVLVAASWVQPIQFWLCIATFGSGLLLFALSASKSGK